jgi:la-related protein 1
MSGSQSRPNGESVPVPPVFSYAQAAKGRTAATTASAMQSHQANASGISTPAKEMSATNTPSAGSEGGDRSVNGSSEFATKVNLAELPTPEWRTAAPTKSASIPTSPSFGTASTSTLPKEDDFILVGVTASELRERSSNGVNDKSSDAADSRKGKKGKKQKNSEKEADKEKEKEKEEVKQEILVPAPLPTVNFWAQRSQELSKKPSPAGGQSSQSAAEVPITAEVASLSKDTKKRGKSFAAEEVDKSIAQNGIVKDSPSPSKGQRRGGDSTGRAKEEQPGKRAGPRGNRVSEKEEKASSNQLPPPVEDAISWPTPETALEEEKRKIQEKLDKEDKDETASNKPRPKEKWVPVPYVPSVSFNTPIPPRGGRGRGGARGGRTEAGGRPNHSSNGATGDKGTASAAAGNSSEQDRQTGKDGARSASLPPPKRQSNEQSGSRKPTNVQNGEKNRTSPFKGELNGHHETRHAVMPPSEQVSEQDSRDSFRGFKADQGKGNENYAQPRSSMDRTSDSSLRGDQFKESTTFGKDGTPQPRERAEGRADRGRGGFRGRGNHAGFPNGQPHPQHVFTNGHGPQQPNNYPIRQSNGPYSPPLQPPFGNQYMPAPSRGRGSSRSQSIPTNGMYGQRFMPNGGVPHMAPLQTSGQMFDFHQPNMQSMSALPYNPYMEHVSVLALVTMQLEYYFSIDNLCKDVYLRKHMDSQGFVFLSFISGFKRIQALTQEFDLLRHACQESDIVELVRGADGADRLRRKEGWEKWVLAVEERDESVRNDGPAYFNHPSPVAQRLQHIMPGHQAMSPAPFSPNGTESNYRPFANGVGIPAPSSQVNGNGINYPSDTPLSAAVADFAPAHNSINGSPEALEVETTFSDDEVSHLTLVFLPKSNNDGSKPKSHFHSASRTFSNGSIDGRSIAEELSNDIRQGRSLTNGSHTET